MYKLARSCTVWRFSTTVFSVWGIWEIEVEFCPNACGCGSRLREMTARPFTTASTPGYQECAATTQLKFSLIRGGPPKTSNVWWSSPPQGVLRRHLHYYPCHNKSNTRLSSIPPPPLPPSHYILLIIIIITISIIIITIVLIVYTIVLLVVMIMISLQAADQHEVVGRLDLSRDTKQSSIIIIAIIYTK